MAGVYSARGEVSATDGACHSAVMVKKGKAPKLWLHSLVIS